MVLAAVVPVCLAVFIGCRAYDRQKEKRLLARLRTMLEQARSGSFHPQEIDESMVSSVEHEMHVFLQDSMVYAKRLKEQKAGVETLISDISHQTVTPLSNITIYSELLEEQLAGGEYGEMASAIRQQAGKLNFLVDSLVKASRLENGMIRTQPKRCDLRELAEDVERQCREKAAQEGMQVELVVPDAPVWVLCDPKWTREACCNILDNALKYGVSKGCSREDSGRPDGTGEPTGLRLSDVRAEQRLGAGMEKSRYPSAVAGRPAGSALRRWNGKVTVSVCGYQMFGRIDVSDYGMGICEEEIPKIFTRFYRSPRAGEKPGAGLGLYLAREIAEAQGGYIKVASKEGEGSVFSVFLPVCAQTAQANVSEL